MTILGIDPGSRRIGYAYLDGVGPKIKVIASGVIILEHIPNFFLRIKEIYSRFEKLINENRPEEVAIESLIYKKSPTSLIKLAQARGAIISSLMMNNCVNIFEYSPNLIKSTSTGYGHASKQQVQDKIFLLTGNSQFHTHDESDAIATGICHILHKNINMNRFLSDTQLTNCSYFKSRSKRISIAQSLDHLTMKKKNDL